MKKYSIVIPTYNKCDQFLRPCIESILKYSNHNEIEICVSANGCKDNTHEYLCSIYNQYPNIIRWVWTDEAIGYARATNKGIKIATGKYVILLNNDTLLLEQPRNSWLERLKKPFDEDMDTGVVGIITERSHVTNRDFLIFFCVMIKNNLFKEIGYLDEDFRVGCYEDTEFCYRAELNGFKIKRIGQILGYKPEELCFITDFPIWHLGEGTVHDKELVTIDLQENKREVERILYSKTRQPIPNPEKPKIVLKHTWPGLGDNLAQSTLPEMYSKRGYDVYMSMDQEYRNPDIKKLIDLNPYIKGYTSRSPNMNIEEHLKTTYRKDLKNTNYVSRVEQSIFNEHENQFPKIYYEPKFLSEWADKTFIDLRCVSEEAHHPSDRYLKAALNNNKNCVMIDANYKTKDIFEYIDIIHSCKKFICAYSGSSVLAAAINKKNVDCYVTDFWTQKIRDWHFFHHTNLNYINIDNFKKSIINVPENKINSEHNNYAIDEFGILHQLNRVSECDKDYGNEYNSYGELSHYLSHLRLGFVEGAVDMKKCKSILDVGFGNGDFLRACQKKFEICAGYDLLYKYLPEGCVKEEMLFNNHYDVMSFFDSLEHFDDIRVLDKLKCKYIVVSVPNCITSEKSWFDAWKHKKPDEHLHHFNEESLTKFVEYSGYKVLKVSHFEDAIRKNPGLNNILTIVAEKIK